MIKQKNQERLELWRIRYFKATGRKPNTEPHNVAPCFFCHRPVWRPVSRNIPTEQHFCAGNDCMEMLIEYIKIQQQEELNDVR